MSIGSLKNISESNSFKNINVDLKAKKLKIEEKRKLRKSISSYSSKQLTKKSSFAMEADIVNNISQTSGGNKQNDDDWIND